MSRLLAILVSTLLGLMFIANPVGAGSVVVSPGAGTIQAAIDAASGPTTIIMMPGDYTGAVNVNKPLKLVAKGAVGIHAGCSAPVAFDITSDHVVVNVSGLPPGLPPIS
jgi:hypothetical protein